jgi:hypothetical protein
MATPKKPPTGRGEIMRRIAALYVKVSESKAPQEREKLKQRIAELTQQMLEP